MVQLRREMGYGGQEQFRQQVNSLLATETTITISSGM